MKTKIIVNKQQGSRAKCGVFIAIMAISFPVSAEYYAVYSPPRVVCVSCAPREVIVVHKTVVHHQYHPPKKKHYRVHRPKQYVYKAVPNRCQLWIPDQCDCCGGCVMGHWESCGYQNRVYYAEPEDNLSVYGGERIDYDRATADDVCPDMNINN